MIGNLTRKQLYPGDVKRSMWYRKLEYKYSRVCPGSYSYAGRSIDNMIRAELIMLCKILIDDVVGNRFV